eukprot:m.287239 g.287239  ORF g.287239 m.287239 type:complete len:155 (-) comp11733_c0_seq1:154-618(-)
MTSINHLIPTGLAGVVLLLFIISASTKHWSDYDGGNIGLFEDDNGDKTTDNCDSNGLDICDATRASQAFIILAILATAAGTALAFLKKGMFASIALNAAGIFGVICFAVYQNHVYKEYDDLLPGLERGYSFILINVAFPLSFIAGGLCVMVKGE